MPAKTVRKYKRRNQYLHFQNRMAQRYGLLVNQKACKEMLEYIRQEKAELIRRDTNRSMIFSVPFLPELRKINSERIISLDDRLIVLFDSHRHQLVTCGDEIKEPLNGGDIYESD